MNIFISNECPIKSAKALDDLRLNKMILESAQMLSTWIHVKYPHLANNYYKPTHKTHPCNVWIRQDDHNLRWLVDHLIGLLDERMNRTGKGHASSNIYANFVYDARLSLISSYSKKANINELNCTRFKGLPTIRAYRAELRKKWEEDKRPPKWTNTNPPVWYNNLLVAQ